MRSIESIARMKISMRLTGESSNVRMIYVGQGGVSMKIVGDTNGIEELKKMQAERIDYLKYIITEAKTNTDLSATFKGSDGQTKFKITYNRLAQELKVEKVQS